MKRHSAIVPKRHLKTIPGACAYCGGPLTVIPLPYHDRAYAASDREVMLCVECVMRALARMAVIVQNDAAINPIAMKYTRRELADISRRAQICPVCGGGEDGKRCVCNRCVA